jgi:serine/threonine protein kinase
MTDDKETISHAAQTIPAADASGLDGLTERLGLAPAPADADPLLGRDIGGIKLVRFIAEGGMGRVYEGLQDKPRRPVAVKVMRPGCVSKEACRRFDNESELLGKLRHPYIAQIFSAGICTLVGAEVPYFVMEFIPDALPITDFAVAHKLTTEQRLELFRKVCEGVAHGHERGVVHRDLKPSNILVEPSGTPKLIDFGVARSLETAPEQMTALTEVGQLIGTVQYMSPEQFSATPADIDARADVYALGVIFYELLTGRPPYEIRRKDIFAAAEVVRRTKPSPPSRLNRSVQPEIEKIAGVCLQKNRAKRYDNASSLAKALEGYLTTPPLSAFPPLSAAAPHRPLHDHTTRIRRIIITAVLSLAAVAALSLFIAQLFRRDAPPSISPLADDSNAPSAIVDDENNDRTRAQPKQPEQRSHLRRPDAVLTAEDVRGLLPSQSGFMSVACRALMPEAATVLAQKNCSLTVELDEIDKHVAAALASHNGGLGIIGFQELDDDIAAILATKSDNDALQLNEITTLTRAACESLSRCKGWLNMSGMRRWPPGGLAAITQHRGRGMAIGISNITEEDARHLSKHRGMLFLLGVESLDAPAAQLLVQHQGPVELSKANGITAAAVEVLRRRPDFRFSGK